MTRELTRRRLLRLAGAGAAATLGGTVLAGCGGSGGDPLQRLRSGGDITIGLDGERPFGFTDSSGRATGESPEVARAVVTGLGGGGLVAVQLPFDRLISGLRDGQFDMITVGLSITPRRCQQVGFSRPDFVAATGLLVPSGNPRGLLTLKGVRNTSTRLGVLEASAEQEYALAAGIPPTLITTFDSQSALFRGVADRTVEVGALTRISLLDEVRRNAATNVEVTRGFYPVVDGRRALGAGAFAFRPEDTEFRAAFDQGLTALQSSGRWLELTAPFGFTADNLPPPGLTTESLCARSPSS
ncbi:amino acid ABC transporter substrate-binding protein (PAAT family) [Pseudonocardia sediminis]|uniref:Amino acid ABC transporter substrate-binding protein (PAAT family) n=1 Tax=Pseudonocardia sediminis TaxID=1397368 RepID=A0A4Q7V0R1_PSEST|nr:transporter substrate-binding domain-containing protein [Pseudonocardia sediminis]RZT88047.1 amino acid ABC transporter substrate-binding protein (PAAT family) [Pseudonocardia sediminis]